MKRVSVIVVVGGLIALLAVGIARKRQPTMYESEARFIQPYVLTIDRDSPPSGPFDEIRSEDFLQEVAEEFGEAEILAHLRTGDGNTSAAKMIGMHLKLLQEDNGVVKAKFQHPDPTVCKGVLREILNTYYRRKFAPGPGIRTFPSITIVDQPSEPTMVR